MPPVWGVPAGEFPFLAVRRVRNRAEFPALYFSVYAGGFRLMAEEEMTHMDRMLRLGTVAQAVGKLMLASVFMLPSWTACAAPPRFQGLNLPTRADGYKPTPSMRLIALAEGSGQVGNQVPDFPSARDTTSLQVPVGRRVTLRATVDNASRAKISYRWRQQGGPTVQLRPEFSARDPSPFTYTQLVPKKPGVILVECRAQFLDAHDIPTGVVIAKRIRVVVLPSPTPAIQTGPVTPNSRRR